MQGLGDGPVALVLVDMVGHETRAVGFRLDKNNCRARASDARSVEPPANANACHIMDIRSNGMTSGHALWFAPGCHGGHVMDM